MRSTDGFFPNFPNRRTREIYRCVDHASNCWNLPSTDATNREPWKLARRRCRTFRKGRAEDATRSSRFSLWPSSVLLHDDHLRVLSTVSSLYVLSVPWERIRGKCPLIPSILPGDERAPHLFCGIFSSLPTATSLFAFLLTC